MTKKESIKKTDEIIENLKCVIKDLKHQKKFYIDFNDKDFEITENLIGVSKMNENNYDLLYYKKYVLFTKIINIHNTKV